MLKPFVTSRSPFLLHVLCGALLMGVGSLRVYAQPASPATASDPLARTILDNRDLDGVVDLARTILKDGLNAGSGYGEVWIRDLNMFVDLAIDVHGAAQVRQSLVMFFDFQGEDGNIIDGYVPAEKAIWEYKYITSATQPDYRGHKNTVETDQETSLVQAVYTYIRRTGDRSILEERVSGRTVRERLAHALDFLFTHRYSAEYGLIWGATTADWGDVQPEHDWGVELDANSHRAIDIYDNAMLVVALRNYAELIGTDTPEGRRWLQKADEIAADARRHLWDPVRHKFIPHLYLEDSPFPADFDENRIYVHGGSTVSIEAGLLSEEEVMSVYRDMVNNRRFAGAATIGLTIYPAYPNGWFKNKIMGSYSYQNGGDWTWFGGRMIQQLIRHGRIEEAYRELLPMVGRVLSNKGFYEWYTMDNQPRGSGTFRGEAGVLYETITQLRQWAEAHR